MLRMACAGLKVIKAGALVDLNSREPAALN